MRQLGPLAAYAGYDHTRYDHSLGTAFLSFHAGVAIRKSCASQSLPPITRFDVGNLVAAALLHDVGHGCLSHFYDAVVGPSLPPYARTHEQRGILLLPLVLGCEEGGEREEGGEGEEMGQKGRKGRKGRKGLLELRLAWVRYLLSPSSFPCPDPEKAFLGSVVVGKGGRVDVDRLDYLCRDAHHVGVPHLVPFDPVSVLRSAMVVVEGGSVEVRLVPPRVEAEASLLRFWLHASVFSSPVSMAAEAFFSDVMRRHRLPPISVDDDVLEICRLEGLCLSHFVDSFLSQNGSSHFHSKILTSLSSATNHSLLLRDTHAGRGGKGSKGEKGSKREQGSRQRRP